ncbi:hypothetical protein SBY92_003206 [Candida maltosa Xu316]
MKITLAWLIPIAYALQYQPFDKSQLDKSSFYEPFDYNSLRASPWKISNAKKFDEGRNEVVKYTGQWAIEAPILERISGLDNDKGLVLKSKSSYYAISYKLPHEINNLNGKDLVLQYEVKLQAGSQKPCGGEYVKLLKPTSSDYSFFSSETPYEIMFGPDKCGSENKIHLIIRKKTPDGQIQDHHLKHPPMSRLDQLTNLYTLLLRKDNTFEIRVNGKVAKAGNLTDSKLFDPPFETPKIIADPNDKMPEDWDFRPTIPDPHDVKPDDWDERVSIDGKPNANYKGKWFPSDIPNPNYKGIWKPKQIPNPNYYAIANPGQIDGIGGIGFELWSIDSDVLFDNIYLGNSVKEAELIGNQTFLVKHEVEIEQRRENKEKVKNEPLAPPKNFDDIITDDSIPTYKQLFIFIKLFLLRQYLGMKDFYFELLLNPISTVLNHPVKLLFYGVTFLFSFTMIFGIGIQSGPPEQEEIEIKQGEQEEEHEEKIEEVGNDTTGEIEQEIKHRIVVDRDQEDEEGDKNDE